MALASWTRTGYSRSRSAVSSRSANATGALARYNSYGRGHWKSALKRILSSRQVRNTVKSLAVRIRADYGDKRPVLVCVLKGAFVFLADLIREVDMPLEVDFITVSSYGPGRASSGNVQFLRDITTDITGRHVLLVDDIVDSGLTLDELRHHLTRRSPASLRVCALLARRSLLAGDPDAIDYLGRSVPDGFVVGYGIDCGEDYRYLPDIWMLEDG